MRKLFIFMFGMFFIYLGSRAVYKAVFAEDKKKK